MKSLLLVIDSGTTNSRIRLLDNGEIAGSVTKHIGAKDVGITGEKSCLSNAIREGIEELLARFHISLAEVDAILASGMITSNAGLVDIPHLPAPAGICELSNQLVKHIITDVCNKPIWFIPGVKTGTLPGAEMGEKDMMRGEETEIIGCMYRNYIQTNALLFHYGSHHKCIAVADGRIAGCKTSITGEMMNVLRTQTILHSTIAPPWELKLNEEWIERGLAEAEKEGLGRALFSVRVLHVLDQNTTEELTSFFVGALLSQDLHLLRGMLQNGTERLVLYGKSLFPSIIKPFLQDRYPHLKVEYISEQDSDNLSAYGAYYLYDHHITKHGGNHGYY